MKPIETNPGSAQARAHLVPAATGALTTTLTTKLLPRHEARNAPCTSKRKPAQARLAQVKGGVNHG
jgi:hypothetical protein